MMSQHYLHLFTIQTYITVTQEALASAWQNEDQVHVNVQEGEENSQHLPNFNMLVYLTS